MELGVEDGNAYIDNTEFISLSVEECEQLETIFSKYTYSRNIHTIFSDDSMNNIGNEVVHIYTYQNDILINNIFISSSNIVSFNSDIYNISNSYKLINEIKEMMNK